MECQSAAVPRLELRQFPFNCVHYIWSPPPLVFRSVDDPKLGALLADLARNAKDPFYGPDLDDLTIDQLAERVSVRAALASVYRRIATLFLAR